jgi:hypothetical protein
MSRRQFARVIRVSAAVRHCAFTLIIVGWALAIVEHAVG